MTRGQITFGITTIVAVGTVIASLLGSYYTNQLSITEKINTVNASMADQFSTDRQRIAKLEESISTIRTDISEIKADNKAILRALK